MTVPDPAAPTAEDVIAAALAEVQWRHQDAAAVVAAVRAMSVQQQAQLIGGEVETGNYGVLPHRDKHPFCIPRSCTHREYERHDVRLVGPWRAEP